MAVAIGTNSQLIQGKYQSNPKFDKRIQAYPSFLTPGGMTRGFIVTADMYNGTYYAVKFLRNPSSVQASHSLDSSLFDPSRRPDDDPTQALPANTSSSVSFSLLFDRTYEVWDSYYADQEVGQKGVYVDIKAMYDMLGMTLPTYYSQTGGTVNGTTEDQVRVMPSNPLSDSLTSPLLYRQVNVVLGGPLTYYGVIQGFNVTWSHWTHKMVPVRAQVDVNLMVLPVPSGTYYNPNDANPALADTVGTLNGPAPVIKTVGGYTQNGVKLQ